jgi:hypothetical protein
MLLRETFDVQLIQNGVVPWGVRGAIVLPCKNRVHDLSQGGEGRRVTFRIKNRGVPAQIARDQFGVWIEQNLARIESVPARWLVRPMNAVAVDLSCPQVGKKAMPHLLRLFWQGDEM